MLSKTTTVVSLLMICAASPLQPLFSSKQAVSSQSFVRHDVPISYKHNAVHVYTTEKIDYLTGVPKIQYAPLYLPEQFKMKNDLNEKLYQESDTNDQNREIRKDHLEPKEIFGTVKTHGYVSYIPGHNIDLLQSVNRSPGLSTNYRSYPETTPQANAVSTDTINYHRALSVFKMPRNDLGPSLRPKEAVVTREPSYDLSNLYNHIVKQVNPESSFHAKTYVQQQSVNPSLEQQLHKNQIKLQDIHELTKQLEAQRVSNHPKLNTLLINLARVYNSHAPLNNHVKYLDNSQKLQSTSTLVRGPALNMAQEYVSRLVPIRVAKPPSNLRRH